MLLFVEWELHMKGGPVLWEACQSEYRMSSQLICKLVLSFSFHYFCANNPPTDFLEAVLACLFTNHLPCVQE